MIELSGLHVHPVKSCRALSPSAWDVDALGLRLDRHLMAVDAEGRALTQREHPALARVRPVLDGTRLRVEVDGAEGVTLDLAASGAARTTVRVWRHEGPALDAGDDVAELLSRHLGVACRLVRLAPEHRRRVNPERFAGEAHTAFSDGYPILLTHEASLEELCRRLPEPVPMSRFRPNLVVRGGAPFAEDGWRRLRIGGVELVVAKPSDRCIVTTTDQETGERRGVEPLRTLGRFRRGEEGVLFGQNCVPVATGRLELGMPVEVLETGPPAAVASPRARQR